MSTELTVERDAFAAAMARLSAIVEPRNTIPILANVQIEVGAGQMRLTATNLDQFITQTIPANGDDAWITTVHAGKLAAQLRAWPAGAQVSLALNDGARHGQCGWPVRCRTGVGGHHPVGDAARAGGAAGA